MSPPTIDTVSREIRRQSLARVILSGCAITFIVMAFYLTRFDNYNYGGNSVALRWVISESNSLQTDTGHESVQALQAMQALASTRRARLRTSTLKAPGLPETFWTSLFVRSSISGWSPTATIFGVRMQAAQSRVGKVLSNIAMCPQVTDARFAMR